MKLHLIVILFCLISGHIFGSAGTTASSTSSMINIDAVEKAIIDAWKPDAENCGPMLRMVDGFPVRIRDNSIIHDYAEGALACMIRGYRDIAWAYYIDARPGFQDVAKKHNIIVLPISGVKNWHEAQNRAEYIMFKPEKKNNALLFYKFKDGALLSESERLEVSNVRHYLLAHLLGTADEDIKAYYALQKPPLQTFESDKKSSLALIEKHTKNINDWAPRIWQDFNSQDVQSSKSAGSAGSAAASACAPLVQSDAQKKANKTLDLKALEEALLKKYSPNETNCGPSYRAKKDGSFEYAKIITDNVEGALACMIRGYRNRTFSGSKLSPELQELAASKKISAITIQHNQTILFAQTAREEGLLLGKLLSSPSSIHKDVDFDYLLGHLLGYADKDMMARKDRENLEEVKKSTQGWIALHKKDLDQWAAKNLTIYPPLQIVRKEVVSQVKKSIKDFNSLLFKYIDPSQKDKAALGSELLAIYDQLSPAEQKEAVSMMHNVGLDFEKERRNILQNQ